MKVVREMFNRTRDQWEFLTDDNHMLVQSFQSSAGLNAWKLYRVDPHEVLDENWEGEEVWSYERDYMMGPELVLVQYTREQNSRYECDLFADLDADTKGELVRAYNHIEAGDLTGAFQHLIQFAAWAIQEYADLPVVGDVWEKYGPHTSNGHLFIYYADGWHLQDALNESQYGPLCPDCRRPISQCVCPPQEAVHCGTCRRYIEDCHCGVEIPF
jgi:hypothetical protein